jgi:hypothetical protein
MACVGRLAGAVLAQTGNDYFLVGNTKEPCDFKAAGFEPPCEVDAVKCRYIRLKAQRTIAMSSPLLKVRLEGKALAEALAERLLIERNGSVSERLWRLLLDPDGNEAPVASDEVDAQWLVEIPLAIWEIVRDTVLRCL